MMNIGSILWLIPTLPALGALINGLRAVSSREAKNRAVTNAFALGTTALSALIATAVVLLYVRHGIHEAVEVAYYHWIPSGMGEVLKGSFIANFNVDLAFRVDTLSSVMMMVVTWVGFLIHVYSVGYMAHEKGYTRFFAYLNLFMFMMLLLVMGNNYIVMFVGWEGVGLCSYLLIGFYYDKNFAADAGKKAFITNRIGDFGFLLGVFLIFNYFGTVDFTKVFALASAYPSQYAGVATAIGIFLFIGACGKSAQIPLYVWLPDAMAGPTPVSALIHAATMVTAGVYMVVRSNVLYRLSPAAMAVVAIVGALTAIFAASIGLMQNDIKKVLAYSTVSQLGYMFIGAGVGAFTAAIFHLMTHAFFKACLFLGAGSVIHGCGGEQDMRKMGGLRKYMPKTHWTFLVATLAISGIPPLAGFFSKDEILASAFLQRFDTLPAPWNHAPQIAWVLGTVAAIFTAFYMFRLYYMTFHGKYRGAFIEGVVESEPSHGGHDLIDDHTHLDVAAGSGHHPAPSGKGHGHHDDAHATPHESPWTMTGVLAVLATLAAIGGLIGPPLAAFGMHTENPFQKFLEPVLAPIGGHSFEFIEASSIGMDWFLIAFSVLAAVFGILVARRWYKSDPDWAIPTRLALRFPGFYKLVANKYYVDEIYQATVIRGTLLFSWMLAWFDSHVVDGLVNLTRHVTVIFFGEGSSLFDRFVVDGAVNGVAFTAKGGSALLRRVQSGFVQKYALIMGGGVVFMVALYLVMRL
ncbi:MAG: NADH-quinone oxidoreductase subunit L [Thermoanaerobaculia bacterium]